MVIREGSVCEVLPAHTMDGPAYDEVTGVECVVLSISGEYVDVRTNRTTRIDLADGGYRLIDEEFNVHFRRLKLKLW